MSVTPAARRDLPLGAPARRRRRSRAGTRRVSDHDPVRVLAASRARARRARLPRSARPRGAVVALGPDREARLSHVLHRGTASRRNHARLRRPRRGRSAVSRIRALRRPCYRRSGPRTGIPASARVRDPERTYRFSEGEEPRRVYAAASQWEFMSADEFDLLDFLATLPEQLDPDEPWTYNDSVYQVVDRHIRIFSIAAGGPPCTRFKPMAARYAGKNRRPLHKATHEKICDLNNFPLERHDGRAMSCNPCSPIATNRTATWRPTSGWPPGIPEIGLRRLEHRLFYRARFAIGLRSVYIQLRSFACERARGRVAPPILKASGATAIEASRETAFAQYFPSRGFAPRVGDHRGVSRCPNVFLWSCWLAPLPLRRPSGAAGAVFPPFSSRGRAQFKG